MFENMVPLNQTKHNALRFEASQLYHYAAKEMLVPVTAGELPLLQREYVIAFSQGEDSLPHALLSVEKGVNAYVRSDGLWAARYVPAHVRRYPFHLATLAAEEGQSPEQRRFTVLIDENASQLGDGELLFTEEGAPTPQLARIQDVLVNLQRDLERTRELVRHLDHAKVLTTKMITFPRADGRKVNVEGLRVVDLQALGSLNGDVMAKLVTSGAMALVYAHLFSLENLKDSVLTRAATRASAQDLGIMLSGAGSVTFN